MKVNQLGGTGSYDIDLYDPEVLLNSDELHK